MSEWQEVKLGDLCEIFDGPHATPPKTEKGNIFLGISSLGFDGRIEPAHFEYVDDFHFAKWTRRVEPRPEDIVFSYETKLGVAAKIPTGFKCCLGRRMGLLRPNNKIDPEFLLWYYLSKEFQNVIHERTYHGSTVDRIPLKDLPGFPVRLPSISEQRAIASVLTSLDDKIDLLHRQNKTLEAMAETLFRQWFVGEAGALVPITNYVDFNPLRKLSKSSIAPYLEMSNVSTSTFCPSDWYDREFKSGTKFRNGDTLLARITPCLENGKSAFVTFLEEDQIGWGSTEFIVMRARDSLCDFFTYALARNQDFRDYAEGCMAGSSGRQRVDLNHLKQYEIGLVDQKGIAHFNDAISHIPAKLHNNMHQIRTLENLRDTLLPKLMSGEIRVAAG